MELNRNDQTAIECDTRYPVMLVHGTGVSDRRSNRCWGRIPDTLKAQGANVCCGRQDAWGSTKSNSLQLAKSVDKALRLYQTDKVNIIAHSKGGLDARALAALPEYTGKIASITTISTPHHGIGWLSRMWPFVCVFIAIGTVLLYPLILLLYGDRRPNPFSLAKSMTRRGSERFNQQTPDLPGIFYQSYAGKMPAGSKNRLFYFTRKASNRHDGDNDGLISVDSAKWGLFRGIFTGGGKRGLSHADETDFFKRSYDGDSALYDDDNIYKDIPQIYVRIVKDLKERGF